MKRLTILCCLLSICVLLSGCDSSIPDRSDLEDLGNRISSVYGGDISNSYEIIVDKETGVMYIATCQGGICVMVDEDGKPLKHNEK